MFIITDWTSREICNGMTFETFEDAWDYILGDLTDRLSLTEDDYQEYYVTENRTRETRYLEPRDIRSGSVSI